eukprot:TRINITY_DN3524_c0_g4_i4.p2 TRINITY_DN3524_c0_g4~~TRINITY_DN3524_c0_g4_i4.p2  ORF type:complete len:111 (+),score=34.10 TRINITY_DN3524_c0_g4_i4:226-558(+)
MGRKTTKAGRSLNPADAYRKQLRKKELLKIKKQRTKIRELILQTKDEGKIRAQIEEIEELEMKGQADKRHKTKKKQLRETLEKLHQLQKAQDDAELYGFPVLFLLSGRYG